MKLFPENNAIFGPAGAIGGKGMRFRVHQQVERVTSLGEDHKGTLGLASMKQVVEDRLAPPVLRERVSNFATAVRDAHASELPHLEAYLLLGGLPLLEGGERSFLVGELRSLVSEGKADEQLVAAFSKVSGDALLPGEEAALRAMADEVKKAEGLLPTLNFLDVLESRK